MPRLTGMLSGMVAERNIAERTMELCFTLSISDDDPAVVELSNFLRQSEGITFYTGILDVERHRQSPQPTAQEAAPQPETSEVRRRIRRRSRS